MYRKYTFFFLIGFLTLPYFTFAQKYSNEFMSIGVGARAHSMGLSVVASVDDVTAGYWNPAGLASFGPNDGLQLGAMHSEWFAGIAKFDYLAASIPLANSNRRLGISLVRFGIDGIPNTLSLFEEDGTLNFDNIVEFSSADYAFLGSYAQKLSTKNSIHQFYIGGNAKVIRRVIGSLADSWGFGLDLGIQYHTPNWSIGLVGRDLTSTFNAWTVNFSDDDRAVLLDTGNELPDINSIEVTRPTLTLGIAYKWTKNKIGLRPEVNLIATTDGRRNTLIQGDPISLDPGAGLEIIYDEFLFFRAGVSQFQYQKGFDNSEDLIARPALGVGLKLGRLQVDYGFSNLGDEEKRFSHVISLIFEMKPRGNG